MIISSVSFHLWWYELTKKTNAKDIFIRNMLKATSQTEHSKSGEFPVSYNELSSLLI